MICILTFIIAPSTARQDLSFSKALLVVHSMKTVFTYTAQLGISWRLGWGQREMKQFINHGWSYAQLTRIFQNDSSLCHIVEKRESRSRMTLVDVWWRQVCLLVRRRMFFRRYGQHCISTSSLHREQFDPLSEILYVTNCKDGQQWFPHQTSWAIALSGWGI
jgi:hypothetical protein